MSTNGQLVFTDVDKITFKGVGNTSNAVVDTVTGKIGVGIDSPDANLHVLGNSYVSTNLELGGTLIMGTVNVSAHHSLEAVTAEGNTTPLTVEFSNATTGIVTTGNVEVGGELTVVSNVNMLHTANTASIKLNSNVVTEFPRSKKLIKYPRVAMTGETTSNYTVTGSSWYGSGANYEPWKAFDNVGNHPSGQLAWYSFDYSAPEAYSGTDNTFNPNHGGTTTPDLFTGAVQGEWLKIQLPHKVALGHYIMYGPNQETEFPQDWTMYGSVDGTNWVRVDSRVSQVFGAGTGASGTATGKKKEYQLDTQTDEYLYFAFVFTKASPNRTTYVGVGEIELYGVPEYDPEAHGTDVVVKSLPNVPNTDWLEVYYDAKNYTNGVVQDETANNRDGILYGNASLNSADGIHKFDFDGTGDFIKTTLTGFTGKTVTFSAWVFMDSVDTTRAQTIMGLGSWGNSGSAAWIAVGTSGVLETGNKGIASCGSSVQATTLTGRWLHITGIVSSGDFRFYQDGQLIKSLTTTGSINYGTNPVLYLATRADSNGNPEATRYFDCKIANARLFNRPLTSDEVWQLYAYQKEYFGHGDLGMTLKAGRLGIGTSEPRAALDVRGGFQCGNFPLQFFVVNGQFPATGTTQTVTELPQGLKDRIRHIVFIQGLTVNTNGDIYNWIRHGSTTWEVDISVDVSVPHIFLSGFDATNANITSKAWRIFVVTT